MPETVARDCSGTASGRLRRADAGAHAQVAAQPKCITPSIETFAVNFAVKLLREPGQLSPRLPLFRVDMGISGADGGIRTRTRVAPQRFLRPRRLPFRHARVAKIPDREHTVCAGRSTRKHPGGARVTLERKTGFEPATFSLARRCSTTEPLPRRFCPSMIARRHNSVNVSHGPLAAAVPA